MQTESGDRPLEGITDQWWVAVVGDMLVWARLSVFESGIAEVFDSSGERPRYDDEQQARMALLDAEFRAFDGLDEEDAALMGFDLDSVAPPQGDDEDARLPDIMLVAASCRNCWASLVEVHESCRKHFGESRYTMPYPWEKRL